VVGGPGNAVGETGVCSVGLCDGDALVCEGDALVCVAGALVCGGVVSADGGFDEGCDAAASGGFVGVCVGVAEWVAPGEPAGLVPAGLVPAGAVGEGGLVVVPEPVHAETETETTTTKVAQAAK